MQNKLLEPKVVRLIRCVEKHPELYDPNCKLTARAIKQTTWDQIAKACGFSKTEDAKCRWRGLLVYFRQVLEAVTKKKLRRYIPNTDNPSDKFMQLSDWRYYKYIKFMESHMTKKSNKIIKIDTRVLKHLEQLSSSIPVTPIPAAINTTATMPPSSSLSRYQQGALKNTDFELTPTTTPHTTSSAESAIAEPKFEIDESIGADVSGKNQYQFQKQTNNAKPTVLPLKIQSTVNYYDLSAHDQNLKSFFDAMLKSTQKLPKYHQERVKAKLVSSIKNNKNI